jgi:hypothetical protein
MVNKTILVTLMVLVVFSVSVVGGPTVTVEFKSKVFFGQLLQDNKVDYRYNDAGSYWEYDGKLGWSNVNDMSSIYGNEQEVLAAQLSTRNSADGYDLLGQLQSIFKDEVIVNPPSVIFASSTTSGIRAAKLTQSSAATTNPSQPSATQQQTIPSSGCNTPQCQEADYIWSQIAGFVKPEYRGKVWNVVTKWTDVGGQAKPQRIYVDKFPIEVTLTKTGTVDKKTASYTNESDCLNKLFVNQGTAIVKLGDLTRTVNKAMVEPLEKVAKVIQEEGYVVHSWHACRPEEKTFSSGKLHKGCLAVDINPRENPFCVRDPKQNWGVKGIFIDRVPDPNIRENEVERCKKGEIVTDLPLKVIQAFEDNGFFWGGRYNRGPDNHHFDFVANGECFSRTYSPLTFKTYQP